MTYSIELRKSVEKDILRLPIGVRRRVVTAIEALRDNPYPTGSSRLSGRDAYRIRVGLYRVLYEVDGNVLRIEIVRVAHRREAYR